ncbi:Tissue factor pathway inhibitor 2 [Vulpes lagopus]|nr:tissue factor pathway inhibitor 2 [Vulpes lagopus]
MNQPGGLGTGTPRPVRGRRTLALHKAGTQPVGTQAARRPDSVHPLPAGTFQERPPGGPRRPDRMDPAGPFGVLLLPLLLMGTALGDGGAGAPGGNGAETCLLPPDVGPCRALIPSYYYDRYTQSCLPFTYGGCRGNANNFETWEACDEACRRIEKVPKICRLEVNEEQCGENKEEYFFNLTSMTCEKFLSGGCHSNENRFPDEATCMNFCAPKKSPSFCYSPKDEGLCSANLTRYYFNPRHRTCEAFAYTGCGGNDNNFVSMKDCKNVCVKALKKERNKKMTKLSLVNRRLKNWKKQS